MIQYWHDGPPERDGSKPLVWLVQEPGKRVACDTSILESYGQVVSVFPEGMAISLRVRDAVEIARRRLSVLQPVDFLTSLPGIDPLSPIIVGCVLREIGASHITWMRWDRHMDAQRRRTQSGYYTPVRVAVGSLF